MNTYFINRKKLFIVSILVLVSSFLSLGAAGLPTFDYSNLITSIESTLKAVEFYNSSLEEMASVRSKIEKFSQAIDKGDFDNIYSGIKDMLLIIKDIAEEIDQIKKDIEKKRQEAEIESKKGTLEILNILTRPSLEGIKGYAEKRFDNTTNYTDMILTVAKDTKKAIELISSDYSYTADEAIKRLENKYIDISRNIAKSSQDLKDSQSLYSQSMTAQQTLTAFLTELSAINRTLDNTKEGIDTLKKDVKNGKEDLEDTIESWKNIIEKLTFNNDNNKDMKKVSESFKRFVESQK